MREVALVEGESSKLRNRRTRLRLHMTIAASWMLAWEERFVRARHPFRQQHNARENRC